MHLILSLLLTPFATAQECPDRTATLDEAEAATVGADLGGASAALERFASSLACGERVRADMLARYWMLEGAVLTYQNDEFGARESLQAAMDVGATEWNATLGPKPGEIWTELVGSERTEQQPGSVVVSPALTATCSAAINGKDVTIPAQVTPGLHALQVHPTPESVSAGQVFYVTPGQTLTVTVPAGACDVALPPPKKKPPIALGVGLGAAAGAVVVSALWAAENAKYETGSGFDPEVVKSHQQALGYTRWGLAAVAATGVTLHFTLGK